MSRKDGHLLRCEAPVDTPVPMLVGMLGPVSGVHVALVGGNNGPGAGELLYDHAGLLSWRAPWSTSFGVPVDVSAGGDFFLADGADLDKWIMVTVTAADLPDRPAGGRVHLYDLYNSALGGVNASPEDTDDWTVYLKNYSGLNIQQLAIWLDSQQPANRWLTLQIAAGASGQPFNEADARAIWPYASVAPGASLTLNLSRTIPAGEPAWPRRLMRIFVTWADGEGGRARIALRGCYRVDGTAGYQAYHEEDADPVPGVDDPFATNATLPFTPDDVFGNGDHRFALTYENDHGLEGDSRKITRIIVSGGSEDDLPPSGPYQIRLSPRPDGEMRVEALAVLAAAGSDRRATHWALWYTTDGSAPGGGDADYTETISAGRGFGRLRYDGIPAQDDGTLVRVLVRTRTGSTDSEGDVSGSLTIDRTGPGAPAGGQVL